MTRARTGQILILVCALISACSDRGAGDPVPDNGLLIHDIADRYYAWTLQRAPEQAYFSAVELERHDGLFDNRPEALRSSWEMEDQLLAELQAVDHGVLAGTPAWITRAFLEQQLR